MQPTNGSAGAGRPHDRTRLGPRELAKWAAHVLATLLVAPLFVSYWIRAAASGPDRALQGATEVLALLPGLPGQYLRRAFLTRVLAHCDRSACVGFGVLFTRVGASVGANVYIGPRCQIGLATIEKDVLLALEQAYPGGPGGWEFRKNSKSFGVFRGFKRCVDSSTPGPTRDFE